MIYLPPELLLPPPVFTLKQQQQLQQQLQQQPEATKACFNDFLDKCIIFIINSLTFKHMSYIFTEVSLPSPLNWQSY